MDERDVLAQIGELVAKDYRLEQRHASDWSILSTPLDALQIANDWIYGIADVHVTTTAHAVASFAPRTAQRS